VQNPRPRKYASDAERQAAFRNRASMLEFRADEKTAEKLTEIADTLDISRSDLLLSMVKFALTNHQWARFGLTHKTLPRYEENPMATKKYVWIVVPKYGKKYIVGRFNAEETAKNYVQTLNAPFNYLIKKQAVESDPEMKTNPATKKTKSEYELFQVDYLTGRKNIFGEINTPSEKKEQLAFLKEERMASKPKRVKDHEPAMKRNPATKKFSPAQIAAQKLFAERARAGTLGKGTKRKAKPRMTIERDIYGVPMVKRNPVTKNNLPDYRKKTDEQLQFIMKDASEAARAMRGIDARAEAKYLDQINDASTVLYERAAKFRERKTNPDKAKPRATVKRATKPKYSAAAVNKAIASSRSKISASEGKTIHRLLKGRHGNPAGYFPNPKVKYTNRAKDMMGDQRVGYAVHMADRPSYQAIAWFSKKDDAVKVAQEASDRTGKQLAVTRVQNYFGAM
jgi:hypothetical protein